jgi:hypothetical protein
MTGLLIELVAQVGEGVVLGLVASAVAATAIYAGLTIGRTFAAMVAWADGMDD